MPVLAGCGTCFAAEGPGNCAGVLKKRGVGLEEFRKLKKGHADKVLLAGELRRSTTMTMAWIARELNAGVPQTLWRALWAKREKSDNTRD